MGKYVETRIQLKRLYAQIPAFECVPGCGDCCGPVPCSRVEKALVPQIGTSKTTLGCAYFGKGGCAVHDRRPYLCRLFGATEDPILKCPHGRGPEKPLSVEETKALTQAFRKILVEGG
jgi:hypothetical protein